MKPQTDNTVYNLRELAELAIRMGRHDLAAKYIDMANRVLYLDSLLRDAEEDVANYG